MQFIPLHSNIPTSIHSFMTCSQMKGVKISADVFDFAKKKKKKTTTSCTIIGSITLIKSWEREHEQRHRRMETNGRTWPTTTEIDLMSDGGDGGKTKAKGG